MKNKSLSQQTAAGMSWQVLASIARFTSRFAIGIALARILTPEEFGVVGIAQLATGFASTFASLGLGPALIQREKIRERHVRTCHTLSFAVAILLTSALYVAAGRIAYLFGDARVEPVLEVLSLTFTLSGFSITANALLVRKLLFRRLVSIEVLAGVVGYGGVSVALAFADYGYWSLVCGMLTQTALSSLLTYAVQRHSLRPAIFRRELFELFRFSFGMSLSSTLNYFARQGDYLVIGRLMNATSLGLYTRAFTLMELPHSFVGSALSRVLFPAAARVQGEPERFRRAYIATLSMSVAVSLPLSLSVAVLAPELIRVLYGPQWLACIPLVQVLSLFGMFRMSYNTAGAFLRAKGEASRILFCQMVYAVTVVGGSWWGVEVAGLEGAAWAVGLAISLLWGLIIWSANRAAGVSFGEFVRSIGHAMAVTTMAVTIAASAVYLFRQWSASDFTVLVASASIFGLATIWSLNVQVRRSNYKSSSKAIAYLEKLDLVSRITRLRF